MGNFAELCSALLELKGGGGGEGGGGREGRRWEGIEKRWEEKGKGETQKLTAAQTPIQFLVWKN
jgi:hypothetical protein